MEGWYRIAAGLVLAMTSWIVPVACGGIAVIDGGAGSIGGAGGAGSSSGAGAGSSSSPHVATGPTGDLCVDACNLLSGCLGVGGCVEGCRAVRPSCQGRRDTFLTCLLDLQLADHLCDLPDPCIVPLQNFTTCLQLQPFGGSCTEEPCECTLVDKNGLDYTSTCQASESSGGISDCTCTRGGVVVGTCSTPGFSQCNPLDDCCGTLFFVPGEPGG